MSDSVDKYENANKAKNFSVARFATNYYKDEYPNFELTIYVDDLLDEFISLYSKVSLTIMLSKYNSSKNKNYA